MWNNILGEHANKNVFVSQSVNLSNLNNSSAISLREFIRQKE